MTTLTLKEFRCVEETDEVGSDSPYFLVFQGDPTRPGSEADLHRVRRDSWDNEISSGSFRRPNAVVTKDIGSNHLVLCALMEEDNDPDIGGAAFAGVENWMRTVFDAYRASGTRSAADMAGDLIPEFRRAIKAYRSNDELVNILRVRLNADGSGQLPLLNYYGDCGHYRVRFTLS